MVLWRKNPMVAGMLEGRVEAMASGLKYRFSVLAEPSFLYFDQQWEHQFTLLVNRTNL